MAHFSPHFPPSLGVGLQLSQCGVNGGATQPIGYTPFGTFADTTPGGAIHHPAAPSFHIPQQPPEQAAGSCGRGATGLCVPQTRQGASRVFGMRKHPVSTSTLLSAGTRQAVAGVSSMAAPASQVAFAGMIPTPGLPNGAAASGTEPAAPSALVSTPMLQQDLTRKLSEPIVLAEGGRDP